MIHDLIYVNYTTVLLSVVMLVFLFSNVSFERRTVRLFMIAISTALVLVVADSIETYTESLSYPTMLRKFVSAVGYSVRPVCIFCVLTIIMEKNMKKQIILALPLIINALISFSGLFCDIAFSYSETNEFVRGPLGWSAYVTSAIYMILLCVATGRYIQKKDYYEAMIVLAIIIISVLSVYLEAVHKFEGFINASIAISVTFYYLYYHTQNYKIDPLTRALNRMSFEVDVERDAESVKAIISLDLNDLKIMNDTQGHQAGDKALSIVSVCIKKNLIRGCKFYRVGGDEFEILYFKNDIDRIDSMVSNIRHDIERNMYSCAIGIAVAKNGEKFNDMMARADALMYEDKLKIKSKNRK